MRLRTPFTPFELLSESISLALRRLLFSWVPTRLPLLLLGSDALIVCHCWKSLALLPISIGQGFDISEVQRSPDLFDNPAYASYTFSGGRNYVDFLTVEHKNSLFLSYNSTTGGAITTDNIVTVTNANVHFFQQQVQQYYHPTSQYLLARYSMVSRRSHVPYIYRHQRVRCHTVASMYRALTCLMVVIFLKKMIPPRSAYQPYSKHTQGILMSCIYQAFATFSSSTFRLLIVLY